MGHWNDIDGWYPADVIHVYAGGGVKFRIRYDGDDEESDVGNERLGQMVYVGVYVGSAGCSMQRRCMRLGQSL